MSRPFIQVQDVSKSFGGARALADVTFDVAAGEVHALCGENGAGKSTLIKVLGGSHAPDSGQVRVDSVPLVGGVRASEAAGIAVIHQESVAFPHLSAAENVAVGREPRRWGGLMVDRRLMRQHARELLGRLGESFDVDRPLGRLPLAQRQMVGVARALAHRCRLLIMDEPTASLSARETEALFRNIRSLREVGVSILYVSHRMEEIFALSDRISVLRDGRHVATRPTAELSKDDLIRLMVGREVELLRHPADPASHHRGSAMLEVKGLSRAGIFSDISFAVRAGEVVGLAGLVGAGRSEVAEAIFGATSYDEGEVVLGSERLEPNSIAKAARRGLALVPEDRQHLGLVLPLSVDANLTLAILRSLGGWLLRRPKSERSTVARLIEQLHVRTASASLPAEALSGGNQQKLVLGKWLAREPRVLILDEPTRGVDVGAKAEIHRLVLELTRAGMATLVISSDLPEILAMSDRILVMRGGRLSGELSATEATQEKILALALPDAPAAERGAA